MLNSAEHEIYPALNVKMPTIDGILTFISTINTSSTSESVTIQNGWNNRISYGCVYAQIRSGLGMHLVTYSNHDTVLFLLIVPIKGRFV